jgi:hypothetical protein
MSGRNLHGIRQCEQVLHYSSRQLQSKCRHVKALALTEQKLIVNSVARIGSLLKIHNNCFVFFAPCRKIITCKFTVFVLNFKRHDLFEFET